MNDSFWVDPERLGRSGQGYYDEQTLLNNLHSGAGDIMLRYSDSFGNDKEGQDFRQTFNDGMASYTGGIEGLSGLMGHIGMGLHQNGQMYGDSRDSADELTYNLQSETDVAQPPPEQPVSPEQPAPPGGEPVPLSPAVLFKNEQMNVTKPVGSGGSEFDESGDPDGAVGVLANGGEGLDGEVTEPGVQPASVPFHEASQFVRSEKPGEAAEWTPALVTEPSAPGAPAESSFQVAHEPDPGVAPETR
ncbi:hypothetical protein [Saccharopolyspora gregorii]|uniref:Uncharacterized protein n=1 Tax=Saccharopolyspora gregorii TaxID=33914 RepID=A0ABP6RWA4_9PSEU|nr:hypothetical protein [Saccharopolyspora gregorii]